MPKTIKQLSTQDQSQLLQLLQRARLGDLSTVAQIKKQLDEIPEIWRKYGDLGEQAIIAWIDLISGPDALLRESLTRKVQELRDELLVGEDAPPLERLLVEQIVCCWLQARHIDTLIAQNPSAASKLNTRQNSAHQRLLKSIQALATLRGPTRKTASPVQIAARLNKERQPFVNRTKKVSEGLAVCN